MNAIEAGAIRSLTNFNTQLPKHKKSLPRWNLITCVHVKLCNDLSTIVTTKSRNFLLSGKPATISGKLSIVYWLGYGSGVTIAVGAISLFLRLTPRSTLGPTPLVIPCDQCCFPGVKRSWQEAHHSIHMSIPSWHVWRLYVLTLVFSHRSKEAGSWNLHITSNLMCGWPCIVIQCG